MAEQSKNSKLKTLAANVKKDPDDSFSKFALALEFIKIDRPDKARILFESIRNNDPEYVGVYYHLGKTYELLGMDRQAQVTYKEGIEIATALETKDRTIPELKEALSILELEME